MALTSDEQHVDGIPQFTLHSLELSTATEPGHRHQHYRYHHHSRDASSGCIPQLHLQLWARCISAVVVEFAVR